MNDATTILPGLAAERTKSAIIDSAKARLKQTDNLDAHNLKAATRNFEAVLVTQMLKVMRKSVPDGGLFEDDAGRDTYMQMLDTELGKQVARQGTLGIAELLEKQLSRRFDIQPQNDDTRTKATTGQIDKSEPR